MTHALNSWQEQISKLQIDKLDNDNNLEANPIHKLGQMISVNY